MKLIFTFFLLFAFVSLSWSKKYPSRAKFQIEEEKDAEFWHTSAEAERLRIMNHKPNYKEAKNVIMFLGDGMSTTTVTAGRILKGQLNGHTGEESVLSIDQMAYSGFSKTYCTDSQVPDSACTATAYLAGVKTNIGMMGLDANQPRAVCNGSSEHEVESFLVRGNKLGKAAGIVTTTTVTHATPGGAYAHIAERGWYADNDLPDEARENGCKDIADQLIASSHHFDVVLGGGRMYFFPKSDNDTETGQPCMRIDGRNLVNEWRELRNAEGKVPAYVTSREELANVDVTATDSLFGLFSYKHLDYDYYRKSEPDNKQPSLAEMTRKAIEMLSKNPNGYTLLVEGGKIDHAHHGGFAQLALHELLALDEAIGTAVNMTSEDDTLIVVTADHGHTLAMGGYSVRGNPIFGLAPENDTPFPALDGKPFTTLLYANGPGYKINLNNETNGGCVHDRENLTTKHVERKPKYLQQAAVPLAWETHGGEDVGVYARGPYSHLLTGVFQQSYIAHVIMYAACISEENSCKDSMTSAQASNRSTINLLGNEVSHEGAGHLLVFFIAMTSLLLAALIVVIVFVYMRFRQNAVQISSKG